MGVVAEALAVRPVDDANEALQPLDVRVSATSGKREKSRRKRGFPER